MGAKEIVFIVLLLIVVIFSVQNIQPVEIKLFFWQISAPAVLTIVICFLLGFLAGWFFRWSRERKKDASVLDE